MRVLITGCAGFIGSHLADQLLAGGNFVIGVDNFNDYYNPKIKVANLKNAKKKNNFKFYEEDILNFENLKNIFQREKPAKVVHLAARAGVRPSIKDPKLYERVNVEGSLKLLKLSAEYSVEKFIFGSSSSVYGESKSLPFSESDSCYSVASVYGASKRAGEFFVESFFKCYGLESIILRFFTVYGPRGRPDMVPALFCESMVADKEILMFGDGSSLRDYTYIDDICDGIVKACESKLKFDVINLGNNNPVSLNHFIEILEKILRKKARIKKIAKQNGDVSTTWANIEKAKKILGWKPKTDLKTGLRNYIKWRKEQ